MSESGIDASALPAIFQRIDPRLLGKFKEFHTDNPWVYKEFAALARKMKDQGRRGRYSAWVIVNVIRWHRDISTKGDVFKINNDYIALYARLLIFHDASFSGFFQLRTMKASGRKLSCEEWERKNPREEPGGEVKQQVEHPEWSYPRGDSRRPRR